MKLQYKIYKYIREKQGLKFFNFDSWRSMQELKQEGKTYCDEDGVLHNLVFK